MTADLTGKKIAFPGGQRRCRAGGDIRNAGGIWVDEEAVTCTENEWTLVTSRNPGDLDAFVELLRRPSLIADR